MGVYEIQFETIVDGKIVRRSQHIECPDFQTAALYAIEFEKKFQHPVNAVGFLFKIAERVQPPEPAPEPENKEGE